jgi:inhibitor of KinA
MTSFAPGLPAEVTPLGEQAVIVRFPAEISEGTFAAVAGALAALDAWRPPAVVDIVPAFASILVLFDPLAADPDALRDEVAACVRAAAPRPPGAGRLVRVPVLYDATDAQIAPDLAPLAAERGLTVDEVVALHTGARYRCHMLGFRPGFPFLGGLPPALHAPRLATPRPRVPAGAVGIGGGQTGIYPAAGPGGWRLIGRTPLRLFDPDRPAPFLIEAGDRVEFQPIDRARFDALEAAQDGRAGDARLEDLPS